ncbi:hypothetical protein JOM56_012384 [Amanita muscaria]
MFDKGQEGLDSATTNTTTSTHESHPQHRPDSDGEFSLYSVRNLDEMDSEANSHPQRSQQSPLPSRQPLSQPAQPDHSAPCNVTQHPQRSHSASAVTHS